MTSHAELVEAVAALLVEQSEPSRRLTDFSADGRALWLADATAVIALIAERLREPEAAERRVVKEWQRLCDADDRTSPEEYPDMVLITRDELAAAMHAAASPLYPPKEGTEAFHPKFVTKKRKRKAA